MTEHLNRLVRVEGDEVEWQGEGPEPWWWALHPAYGPCDALGPSDSCSACRAHLAALRTRGATEPEPVPYEVHELAVLEIVDEREHREEQITQIARALGVTEEWSSAHDLGDLALDAARRTGPEPCSTCGGSPHPSGKVCVCGGVGTMLAEVQGLRRELYARRTGAEPSGVTETLTKALGAHRLWHWECDEGEAMPLIDRLSAGDTIATGRHEIERIVETIRASLAPATGRAESEPDDRSAKCSDCGRPATCFGSYEMHPASYACDVCCGHGNEDGWCMTMHEVALALTVLRSPPLAPPTETAPEPEGSCDGCSRMAGLSRSVGPEGRHRAQRHGAHPMSEQCGNRLRRGGWRVHGGVMTPYHVVGAACTLPKGHAGPCEPDRSTYAHVDSDDAFDLLHQDTDTR